MSSVAINFLIECAIHTFIFLSFPLSIVHCMCVRFNVGFFFLFYFFVQYNEQFLVCIQVAHCYGKMRNSFRCTRGTIKLNDGRQIAKTLTWFGWQRECAEAERYEANECLVELWRVLELEDKVHGKCSCVASNIYCLVRWCIHMKNEMQMYINLVMKYTSVWASERDECSDSFEWVLCWNIE